MSKLFALKESTLRSYRDSEPIHPALEEDHGMYESLDAAKSFAESNFEVDPTSWAPVAEGEAILFYFAFDSSGVRFEIQPLLGVVGQVNVQVSTP